MNDDEDVVRDITYLGRKAAENSILHNVRDFPEKDFMMMMTI
jgi:hypothetical protein